MRINTTRERLAKGEVVYGCGLQVYRSPEIPRLFAAAGFDYVFIDMEHGSFNLETAHDMIIACKLAGITPIVRVGEVQYTLCARLLDQGAQGIILPRVEDPKMLEEALSWMRFPPLGKRGYGINPTMVDYEARAMPGDHRASESRDSDGGAVRDGARRGAPPTSCFRLPGPGRGHDRAGRPFDLARHSRAVRPSAAGVHGRQGDRQVQRARRGARDSDARRRHGANSGRSAECASWAWPRSTFSCWRNARRRWRPCVRRRWRYHDRSLSTRLQHVFDPRAAVERSAVDRICGVAETGRHLPAGFDRPGHQRSRALEGSQGRGQTPRAVAGDRRQRRAAAVGRVRGVRPVGQTAARRA